MKTCQALDQDGLRCSSRKGVELCHYHGDNEIYSGFNSPPTEPGWVLVALCSEHRSPKKK